MDFQIWQRYCFWLQDIGGVKLKRLPGVTHEVSTIFTGAGVVTRRVSDAAEHAAQFGVDRGLMHLFVALAIGGLCVLFALLKKSFWTFDNLLAGLLYPCLQLHTFSLHPIGAFDELSSLGFFKSDFRARTPTCKVEDGKSS